MKYLEEFLPPPKAITNCAGYTHEFKNALVSYVGWCKEEGIRGYWVELAAYLNANAYQRYCGGPGCLWTSKGIAKIFEYHKLHSYLGDITNVY